MEQYISEKYQQKKMDLLHKEIVRLEDYLGRLMGNVSSLENRIDQVERELENLDFSVKHMEMDMKDVIASISQTIKYREY